MNYENWISYRYLTSSKGGFLSFLNFVSVAGIAIGVMALIIVIGVMTGFSNNLRDKIIGTTPHIVIEKEGGVKDYEKVIKRVETVRDVKAQSPYVQGNVFIEYFGQAQGIVIRGIDPKREVNITKISEYLVKGNIKDLDEKGIIVGSELARYFGFKLGDKLTLIAPGSGVKGGDWRYKLSIVGIFKSGMVDYDMNLVVGNLVTTQKMFNMAGNTVTGIGLHLSDAYLAEEIKHEILKLYGVKFLVKSWVDVNRNLFEALWLEKWGLFVILTLMILVASFNIISTLIVTVTSKIQDIGILKSVGVPNQSIRRIFTKLGMFIGSVGTCLGFLSGVGICYVLRTYVKVPEEIYSIEHVPVDLQIFDMFAIVAAAMIITYVSTIYPANRAAQLEPVEALRYG